MINSIYRPLREVTFPEFSGIRIMMMPVEFSNMDSIPNSLEGYKPMIEKLFNEVPDEKGVGYLTIDEKFLKKGETHRRPGLHVDGMFNGGIKGGWGGGGWGGSQPIPSGSWGGGGGWGGSNSSTGGFILASNVPGCRAWKQTVWSDPINDGECGHMEEFLKDENSEVLKGGIAYWLNPMCVHESLPMDEDKQRQLIRLSFPNDCPWFEGYTENPLGVKATGIILPRRKEMDA